MKRRARDAGPDSPQSNLTESSRLTGKENGVVLLKRV
jgi:hypothetical protein